MGGWGRPHVSDSARLSIRSFGAARSGVCFDGGVGHGGAAFGFPIPSLTGNTSIASHFVPRAVGLWRNTETLHGNEGRGPRRARKESP
jgi:hypothetical protein